MCVNQCEQFEKYFLKSKLNSLSRLLSREYGALRALTESLAYQVSLVNQDLQGIHHTQG